MQYIYTYTLVGLTMQIFSIHILTYAVEHLNTLLLLWDGDKLSEFSSGTRTSCFSMSGCKNQQEWQTMLFSLCNRKCRFKSPITSFAVIFSREITFYSLLIFIWTTAQIYHQHQSMPMENTVLILSSPALNPLLVNICFPIFF